MGARFLISFFAALLATIAVLGGVGMAMVPLVVPAPRDLFRAPAFDFELAPGWQCELDRTEYVCRPAGPPPHAAIAVIALKVRNRNDTLQAYENHLRDPKKSGIYNDRPDMKLGPVRRRIIGAREWVEALHTGIEVPNYETYYLATATSFLGILVTMSVHKDQSAQYIAQLKDMMRTLSVYQR